MHIKRFQIWWMVVVCVGTAVRMLLLAWEDLLFCLKQITLWEQFTSEQVPAADPEGPEARNHQKYDTS